MESGKKPSIFSDRSTIGSVSELDEYGVWVKSEPEDITFDDDAFLSGFDEALEAEGSGTPVEDGESSDFDMDFGTFEPETSVSEEAPVTDGGSSDFDMDFGNLEPETPVSEEAPVTDGGSSDFEINLDDIPDVPQTGAEAADDGYDFEINLDDIPDVPQTGTKTAEPPQGVPFQNELLLKIADELSAIKAEINDLKKEISTIRGENTRASGNDEPAVSLPDEDPTIEFTLGEPAAGSSQDEAVSFDIPPDEAPASDFPPDEAVSFDITTDEAPAADFSPDEAVSFDIPPAEAPVPDFPPDEAVSFDIPPDEAPVPECPPDETVSFDIPPDEAPVPEFPPDEATVSVDLDLRDELTLEESPDGFELTAYETKDEIVVPFAEALEEAAPELPVTPDYLSPDELLAINEAKMTDATPPAAIETDIPEAAQPLPPPVEEAAEATPEPLSAQLASRTADAAPESVNISSGFKKDLVVVLSYMDKLLEALPDEKIEEFARSEQFDVYKRLFTELGLA
jgi:hypothetical protein